MTDDSGRSADALKFLENVSLTREGGVGGKPDFIGIRKRSEYRALKRYGCLGVIAYRANQAIKRMREDMKKQFFS